MDEDTAVWKEGVRPLMEAQKSKNNILCTIHKEVLLSRFLLLVFVDKTCRTALSFRFPTTPS